jgi:hypothetical protein
VSDVTEEEKELRRMLDETFARRAGDGFDAEPTKAARAEVAAVTNDLRRLGWSPR